MLKGKYFYRLIWLICISACIPVVLASIVYYHFSMNREIHQFYANTESSLELAKDRVERELQRIEHDSMQLAMDPLIKDSFAITNFRNEIIHHMFILRRLMIHKNSHSLIRDIVYYNMKDGMILSNKYGYMNADKYRYADDLQELTEMKRESQWVYLPQSREAGLVHFARKLPIMSSGSAKGLIIYQLDAERMRQYLVGDVTTEQKSVFMIDTQDRILLHSRKPELHGVSLSDDPVLNQIREMSNATAQFHMKTDQDSTFYSYLKTPYGITYVTSLPEKEISRQMSWIRGFTVLLVLGFTGLGLVLTYVISRRAYDPIEQLVRYSRNLSKGKVDGKENELIIIRESMDYLRSEKEKLVNQLQKIEPSLREQFLQRLAEREYIDTRTIVEESKTFDIPVNRVYVVIVVKLENFYKEKRFLPEERPVAAFAIRNIVQELLDRSTELEGYVFKTKESEEAVLLHFDRSSSEEVMLNAVRQYAESIQEAIHTYLSFTISVGIGRFYPHIADVPVSCNEAQLALQHRMYLEHDNVIHIEDLHSDHRQSLFFYPRNLETAIINALQKDDLAQAEQSLNEFADTLRASKSHVLIYQSYYILLTRIIHSLEETTGNILDILENNLFGKLQERQTTTEIYDWFIDEMFPLYRKLLGQNQATAGKSVIMQVCKHIRDNVYSDLSLIQCAEQVGISPSYLSRLFKKETGVSFLDYVKETKVDEAKRLLLETDDNVKEIADRIGYSERNLNRMFKQYLKMSPSQYRMTNR